jgi:hypothetical protein
MNQKSILKHQLGKLSVGYSPLDSIIACRVICILRPNVTPSCLHEDLGDSSKRVWGQLKRGRGNQMFSAIPGIILLFCTNFIQTLQHDYVGGKLPLSTIGIDELIMLSLATNLATNCYKVSLGSFRRFCTEFIQTLQDDYHICKKFRS